MAEITPGLTASLDREVTADDTAAALGSGDLPVLGTPRLVAWCEAATCAALADVLEPGQTSVGTRVAIDHRAASGVGAALRVAATVIEVDGRAVRFEVVASDSDDRVVGSGEVRRAVVEAERFLARLPR